MGNARDLEYLAIKLEEKGAVVLQSCKNEYMQSLAGIKEGAERLVEEIHEIIVSNPQLDRISFVGNSLGGLFVRYAVVLLSLMSQEDTNTVEPYLTTETAYDMGIKLYPHKLMTIASPHLGVLDHVYLQDVIQDFFRKDWLWFPDWIKYLISKTMIRSGKELFLNDNGAMSKKDVTDSLVYRMSTEERWLKPLRAFKKRRLYANLDADFAVPLSTAAFLEREEVVALRKQKKESASNNNHNRDKKRNGVIVQEIVTAVKEDGQVEHKWIDPAANDGASGGGHVAKVTLDGSCKASADPHNNQQDVAASSSSSGAMTYSPREDMYCTMRSRLNALGWEKVIVDFPGSLVSSHNKLAAVRRDPEWFFDGMLGFHAGDPIMDHASEFLTSDLDAAPARAAADSKSDS
jgi:hypothetical protein